MLLVLDETGLSCRESVDEPSAANGLLSIQDGAVVDMGGISAFPGMAEVVKEFTGLRAAVPERPMFVIGIALHNSLAERN